MNKGFHSVLIFFRLMLLSFLKILSHFFYTTKQKWLSLDKSWDDVELVVLLNHTSLFEFAYTSVMPFSFLKKLSKHLIFPVADITYKRKFFGTFLKVLGVSVRSLSRKKDNTWFEFLKQIQKDSILIFLPEGRMKRKTGLDKQGKKMTVRGGIIDVLQRFKGKKMIFAYSGGLHHVLAPGDRFPKIWKNLAINLEAIKVNDYLTRFTLEDGTLDKIAIFRDLENRRDLFCPFVSHEV